MFPENQNQITINFFIESTGMCVTTEYFHQISEDQHSMFTSPHHVLELGILGHLFFTIG